MREKGRQVTGTSTGGGHKQEKQVTHNQRSPQPLIVTCDKRNGVESWMHVICSLAGPRRLVSASSSVCSHLALQLQASGFPFRVL